MASCPLCDRFTGSPDSVEAHISGSNDDNHEGKIGREFREQIREKYSEPPEPSEMSSSSDGMPDFPEPETTGEVKTAKIEEDEDGNVGLTLVATGMVALFLYSLLNGDDPDNLGTWENV